MYRVLFFAVALLVATTAATIVGCSSSSSPSGDPSNSFRVNGEGFSDILIEAIQTMGGVIAVESDGMGSIGLLGTDGSNTYTATLTISNVKTGTFQINAFDGVTASLGVVTPGSGLSIYFAKSGTITIDSWGGVGGRAKGSFEAEVEKTSGSGTVTLKGNFDVAQITVE
ncbi:MAG: hypothetical protein ACO3I4_02460 [Candidatus Kapaibacteriota bacterium]